MILDEYALMNQEKEIRRFNLIFLIYHNYI